MSNNKTTRSGSHLFFKEKLNWKRPLFYVLLPIFFVMAFLGFPMPVAPPPATKARQEESAPVKKKKQHATLLDYEADLPASDKPPRQRGRTSGQ
jgi:hypothetical protein